jgi:hypothetical protein
MIPLYESCPFYGFRTAQHKLRDVADSRAGGHPTITAALALSGLAIGKWCTAGA